MRAESDVVLIALGSNIEPELNLPRASARLAGCMTILAASRVYESAPVGAPGTPPFLNAVLRVETRRGPRTLKFEILRAIEAELGRRREPDRNAPRTIDLDLVLYGDRVETALDLTLPDPDLARFPHLAVPAADVAPETRHPATGRTLAAIAAALDSTLVVRPDVLLVTPRPARADDL
ncbi:MAG: 2-amino-4-hydroxy-6-hydroxymethyldihydropteridine diphosphokinase, partial [Acidobacteriota bacterium]|nr:2-amino-4-hydroxy-6-hydroxymethyldihydropteridine diphosphokinase [Acidobacteriota bacterium]